MKRIVLAGIMILAVGVGRAADGVTDIRINPETGYTISTPGSYRLVGDVTMTQSYSAISITCSNVTVDLGGHTINGFTSSDPGIHGAELSSNITVANGTIRNFGGAAVSIGPNGVIRNVRAEGVATGDMFAYGLMSGAGSIIEGCTITNCTAGATHWGGIIVNERSRVIGNVIGGNSIEAGRITGIRALQGSVIEGNIVQQNSATESAEDSPMIWTYGPCIIRNNTIVENTTQGEGDIIGVYRFPSSLSGSLIEGNICSDMTASSGSAIGIHASNSSIIGNVCSNNTNSSINGSGQGIFAGNESRVERNRCMGNNIGIRADFHCHIEGNTCGVSQDGAPRGYGIAIHEGGNFVAGNVMAANGAAGLIFYEAADNRSERNRFQQTIGIDLTNGVAPASQGTGDLADISY